MNSWVELSRQRHQLIMQENLFPDGCLTAATVRAMTTNKHGTENYQPPPPREQENKIFRGKRGSIHPYSRHERAWQNLSTIAILSNETKGPGERPPKIAQKCRLRNWPISRADFPMTPMEGTEHHFGPFLGEGFWGNIRRPLVLPAPLFYC